MIVARYDDAWKVVGDASSLGEGAAPVTLWQFPGLAARDVGTGGGTSTIPSYPGTEKTVARVADLLPDAVSSVHQAAPASRDRLDEVDAELDGYLERPASAGGSGLFVVDASPHTITVSGAAVFVQDSSGNTVLTVPMTNWRG